MQEAQNYVPKGIHNKQKASNGALCYNKDVMVGNCCGLFPRRASC